MMKLLRLPETLLRRRRGLLDPDFRRDDEEA